MTADASVANPSAGGSYTRNADGTLTQVEGLRNVAPQAATEHSVKTAGSDAGGEPPAGPVPAGP